MWEIRKIEVLSSALTSGRKREIEQNANEKKSKMRVLFINGVNQLADTLSAM